MKILVPFDVWQADDHLPQDLAHMLPLKESEVILAYALQSVPQVSRVGGSGEYDTDYLYVELEKKAKEALEEHAKELKNSCRSVKIRFEHGPPASVIETVAEEEKVDLTVIRGSTSGLLESSFLGSTVSLVIKHNPSSVMVLRSGPVMAPLQKVIVALDGSELAKEALRTFCQFYKTMAKDLEIVLVHVVSIPGPWRFIAPVEFVATLEDNLDMAAKAILAEGETILKESGWQSNKNNGKMPGTMIIRSGDPASELDRLASEIGAHLIVVGSQGKTAVRHFLMGSVSEALAVKSSYPVFIYK